MTTLLSPTVLSKLGDCMSDAGHHLSDDRLKELYVKHQGMFNLFTDDLIFSIVQQADLSAVNTLCRSSKRFTTLCRTPRFTALIREKLLSSQRPMGLKDGTEAEFTRWLNSIFPNRDDGDEHDVEINDEGEWVMEDVYLRIYLLDEFGTLVEPGKYDDLVVDYDRAPDPDDEEYEGWEPKPSILLVRKGRLQRVTLTEEGRYGLLPQAYRDIPPLPTTVTFHPTVLIKHFFDAKAKIKQTYHQHAHATVYVYVPTKPKLRHRMLVNGRMTQKLTATQVSTVLSDDHLPMILLEMTSGKKELSVLFIHHPTGIRMIKA